MDNWLRVVPFVWPHRKKIVLSILFACLVGVLWSVNLSVAFPVVKVLLHQESLSEYVDKEIGAMAEEVEKRTRRLNQYDADLRALEGNGDDDLQHKRTKLLDRRVAEQSKLATASQRVALMEWVKLSIIPWLPTDQFDTLALVLGVLIFAIALKGICIFIQEVLVGSVVQLTILELRKESFRRALMLDYQTLTRDGTPELMSRFTFDMNVLASGLSLLGGKVIREPIKATFCIGCAFAVNWRLTLLSTVFAPLAACVFYRIGRRLKAASHRLMESMSRIYKVLEESLDGIKVVIAFGGARLHRQRFHRENKEYYKKALQIVRIDALTSPATEVLGMLAVFIAVLPGAYLVLRGTTSIWGVRLTNSPMDIAELSVLYAFLIGVMDPIRKLSSVYAKLKRAAAAADRIFAFLDQETQVRQTDHPRNLPRASQSVEFRNVSFRYGFGGDEFNRGNVLNGVSVDVPAGTVVAVVGENGSGKSTLVQLLPRFFDPQEGSVLIDGVDIRDARLKDLRAQISVVTQETVLFDQSIYENICYSRTGASREDVEQAVQRAHVDQFANDLPQGLETVVGEKGRALSGGQRQRIALARAILRDPSILILDEATSAIDRQSESLIHTALRDFAAGRTTFIITHSLSDSLLDFVTMVVVMDEGRLVGCGSHAELLATCPKYAQLYGAASDNRDDRAA